jgi:hypothetical protein
MTRDEMMKYAQSLIDGAPVKKAEVLAFMRAFADPDLQAGGPAEPPLDLTNLPPLYFDIEKTDSGIHVPRDANRAYTKREGLSLLAKLAQALK